MWCAHWHRQTDYSSPTEMNIPYLERVGECRLNPEPISTSAVHVCAKFQIQMNSTGVKGDLPLIPRLWLSKREDIEERKELRAEVRRLKAVNKDLRAKLRAKTNPKVT